MDSIAVTLAGKRFSASSYPGSRRCRDISSPRMTTKTSSAGDGVAEMIRRSFAATVVRPPCRETIRPGMMFWTPTNPAIFLLPGSWKTAWGEPAWATVPSIITAMRWASRCPCARSWVLIRTVIPASRFRSATIRSMVAVEPGSRFAVGSSRKRISGSVTSTRESATRCCSPPERSVARLLM
ncbi:MAG: hypothetical protein BWX50_01683 [Euryarchaeota archaeon ADurb.Bin009]|nr:MAG: hypothetical protein BWX50_01683 [Euryarchaeota archaeon ADurb.Bin009]